MNQSVWIALFFILGLTHDLSAESSDTLKPLQYKFYAELYYGIDFPYQPTHNRPSYLYSFHRSRELNLNLGMASVGWDDGKIRAALGLMAGTYVQQNLAAEPSLLQPVYEARLGVKLSRKQNWWLDAGIFPSHIGFESAIGLDCPNLTRSILADNSPYYEAGIKTTYNSPNQQWTLSLLLLNGWQRIRRIDGNKSPAFGHQVQWKPNSQWLLNSSSYIGNDQPDSIRAMRYFHNFYLQYNPDNRWFFTAGFDIGAQQASRSSQKLLPWFSPVAIIRWKMREKLALAARVEYYQDTHRIIITDAGPEGSKITGLSLNGDWQIHPLLTWRNEIRYLTDPVQGGRTLISSSLAFLLQKQ